MSFSLKGLIPDGIRVHELFIYAMLIWISVIAAAYLLGLNKSERVVVNIRVRTALGM